MSTELSPMDKQGFISASNDTYPKEASAIKRLWNDPDGRRENSKYKMLKCSGKGFYDRSAEAIFLEKKTKKLFLVQINTSYGNSWKSPDIIYIHGIKQNAESSSSENPFKQAGF